MLAAIGVLHMLLLGADVAAFASDWIVGGLWTFEHWAMVEDQPEPLVRSGLAFWSTLGSPAVPFIVLGALFIWLDRRAVALPRFAVAGLLGWSLLLALAMPPSGFVILALAALAMSCGRPRGGWA